MLVPLQDLAPKGKWGHLGRALEARKPLGQATPGISLPELTHSLICGSNSKGWLPSACLLMMDEFGPTAWGTDRSQQNTDVARQPN